MFMFLFVFVFSLTLWFFGSLNSRALVSGLCFFFSFLMSKLSFLLFRSFTLCSVINPASPTNESIKYVKIENYDYKML